jgi:hypothetical protein
LVNLRFLGTRGGGADIDDLLTELPAAAVLMWASLVLALAFTRRKLAWFALAGLLLGIMALIKAAILYVFVGIVGVWLAVNLWRRSAAGMLAVGREVLILGVAFSCIVAPWMCRNLLEIGSFEISQRAGVVLMYRALHNLMTPGEYFGSFYAWAPPRLQPTVGKMLGFTPADLQRNGRLQRLNDDLHSDFAADDLAAELAGRPDLAISFYWQARAQREQAEGLLAAQGRTEAESAGAIHFSRTPRAGARDDHPLHVARLAPDFPDFGNRTRAGTAISPLRARDLCPAGARHRARVRAIHALHPAL